VGFDGFCSGVVTGVTATDCNGAVVVFCSATDFFSFLAAFGFFGFFVLAEKYVLYLCYYVGYRSSCNILIVLSLGTKVAPKWAEKQVFFTAT
jgi:hypothetical protein